MDSTTPSSFSSGGPAGVLAAAHRLVATVDDTLWSAKPAEEIVDTVTACEMLRAHLAALEACRRSPRSSARGIAKTPPGLGLDRGLVHPPRRHPPPHRAPHRPAGPASSSANAPPPIDALARRAGLPRAGRGDRGRRRGPSPRRAPPGAGRAGAARRGRPARRHRPGQGRAQPVHVVDPDGAERKARKELERRGTRRPPSAGSSPITDDGAGGVRLKGRGTVEDAAIIKAALLPLTKPAPAVDPHDPDGRRSSSVRDHGARLWDALVQTAQHALDTDLPPDAHGARPRLAVTTTLEALQREDRLGHPRPPTTGRSADHRRRRPPLPATVRRLACDADLIPVALGTRGEVLDVGRTHRLVTPAIWTALVCRDQHCAFPGCTRPPVMCHAHHILHWADGGTTALVNLVLLCGHHHRTIHDTPWQVRLNPDDGRPEFLPPPKPGRHHPAPDWIRQRPRRE